MTLKLKERVKRPIRVRVTDSTGTVWRKVRKTRRKQVWKATATQPGTGVVRVRIKRSDGRVFRRSATYTVIGPVPPPPTPTGPLMGVWNSPNDHGGQMAWDSWRVYSISALLDLGARQGELRPKALLYSKQSEPLSGSYQAIYDSVVADLNEFYYSGGNTRSARWGVKVYWSNGNEMSNKGMLATTPHSAAAIDSFLTSQRALYDAVHLVENGERRFPDAYAGSDPTTEQERIGIVADWLHPSIRYHDFVAWSVYPAGRNATPDDPTFNWPSTNPADALVMPHGYMVRCFERVKQALDAAGMPRNAVCFHVGETGIGDDPDDPTTRPYWATYGFMHPLVTISEGYGIPLGTVNWWDAQLTATSSQNILSDEDPTTPSTRQAWQDWHLYDTCAAAPSPRPGWGTRRRAGRQRACRGLGELGADPDGPRVPARIPPDETPWVKPSPNHPHARCQLCILHVETSCSVW